MIYLKNDIKNKVALTLSENDSVSRTFYMDVENLYTRENINNIELNDMNIITDRYNLFYIGLSASDITGSTYSTTSNTTLLNNFTSGYYSYSVKNINGDILEIGKLLIDSISNITSDYTPE